MSAWGVWDGQIRLGSTAAVCTANNEAEALKIAGQLAVEHYKLSEGWLARGCNVVRIPTEQ